MAEATDVIEQQPSESQAGTETSFEEFSKARAEGKVDGHEEPKPEPAPVRDDKGRFAKVRASLERAQQRSNYVHAVLEGAVEPDESTMDSETWAAARNAQIARGSNKITPPEFPTEKTGPSEVQNAEQLSPEETQHIEAHNSFMSSVAAKLALDPEISSAMDGVRTAIDKGAPAEALAYLGHCMADVNNPHEVLITLGKNPEVISLYTRLPPEGMRAAVQELSRQLALQKASAESAKPKQSLPSPPSPVGGRATASAFDVNDETMPPDEWAKRRNEHLAKQGRR